MAVEQFPNGPTANLNGAIDNVTPTVNITPTAGTWPGGPQYRLLFVNTGELALVTGVSGTTLTCTRGIEGTTAVSHLNAEPLQAVPTGGGLTFAFARIDQNNAGPGNFASMSATGLYSQVQSVSRVVGSVAPGQGTAWTPAGGPYSVGDVVQDISNAVEYVCTVAGTPGTWIAAPSLFLAQIFTAQQQINTNVTVLNLNRTDGAGAMAHIGILRAGSAKAWLGLDVSDQFALYNAAFTAANLGMTDLGIATLRNALNIPPSAGAGLAATSYGTVPVKIAENLLGSGAATITFSSLPTGFRHLLLEWYARSDTSALNAAVFLKLNNDATAANYQYEQGYFQSAAATVAEGLNAIPAIGLIPAATATANFFGIGEVKVMHYGGTVGNKLMLAHDHSSWGTTTGTIRNEFTMGTWKTTATAVNRLDLTTTGNFITASLFTLTGEP